MFSKAGYENAVKYPNTDTSMFQSNFWINLDKGCAERCDQNIILNTTPFAKHVDKSLIQLPTYDVGISKTSSDLKERFAVLAIGSNSSPDIMIKKLKNIGGEFLLAQAQIENHAVVHAACIGVAGTVPATIMPNQDTTTDVTISFLTAEQATALTGTEWNYDVVQSGFAPSLRQGTGIPVIDGALMYVSPWGALTIDQQNPLALKDVPSSTELAKLQSIGAMGFIADILGENSIQKLFDSFPGDTPDKEEKRLKAIFEIQKRNALPATIQGQQAWAASIGPKYEALGHSFPAIRYT
ncbi:MAG: hypothetical protein DI586_01580 [Micavibrio aeruginosavorus]|uniref:Uncharacterized protein n=1 Tax=Micavibrio aeruginosavorus TaxID=349221 RepID=A0A2W5FQ38_9BACT|nr:MAG: hypothetical protein DI586_01580 [Micavibrio aeruginosavorus]